MSIEKAIAYARKARKTAPPELYEFARTLELALLEVAKSVDPKAADEVIAAVERRPSRRARN